MYLDEDHLLLSPSDLNNFVQCRHLTALDEALLRGEVEAPSGERDPIADLLSEKGDRHERAYLDALQAEGREIAAISSPERGLEALRGAAAETADAMRAGAEVIYQATFVQPSPPVHNIDALYRGHADFLFRVDRPSALGDHSYEVADAKLARRAKPYFILQLCFYSELVEAVQGGGPPERIHVILGAGEVESYRLAEFAAYFRQVRERFLAGLAARVDATYPDPVSHCQVCRWSSECDERRVEDDHLSLVAGLPSTQRKRLTDAGITTLAGLGRLDPDRAIAGIRPEQLAKRRHQAALQLQTRETDEPALDLLEPEPNRGFARMPEPSDGDLFFDLEGDPFFDGGLEYLWGFVTDHAEPEFTVWWGRDRDEERQAFEQFIDFVVERRRRWPDLHVYHYAAYEITALKRLAGAFGSREAELDQLLRERVFVDLYRVVAESARIGMPSYSLKKVEAFYMDQRETEVTDGNDSVIEFERWLDQGGLEAGDQSILDAIADYNRDDCVSTLLLRNWLLERRADAETHFERSIEWFQPEATERGEDAVALDAEVAALLSALSGELEPEDLTEVEPDVRSRWLLGQLLEYHQREARPVWWAFFDRRGSDPDSLIDDAECIAGLRADSERPSRPVGGRSTSTIFPMLFEPQETKLGPGSKVHDVADGEGAGEILALEREHGRLEFKRGPSLNGVELPQAVMPGGPYRTPEQRAALRRLARDVIDQGLDGSGAFRACRDLVRARAPRIAGIAPGEPLYADATSIDELRALVAAMDETCLVVQGPPGSGKTYTGARLITGLIAAGKRIGVTANSHKVIHNMLDEVETAAAEDGLEFTGLKKSGDGEDTEYESDHIGHVKTNPPLTDPAVQLAAGTAWHFAREETDGTLDYLFIDEAGQVSLADALALGTAARNIVLLGDPQQLPQVTQGAHPAGSAVSAFEHVLGDEQTIPVDRGVFLDKTWRMHPDVARFCSELMYDGRLGSAPGRERQRLVVGDGSALGGTGLRWCPVEHDANTQSSLQEADAIAALLAELGGARVIDCEGIERELELDRDVLVVTPYNAQVKCLESRLPAGLRIGTVDKFQGQEAEIVFFSLATSSGAEFPRGLEFLLSRNRLNVAVSRARCVAIVVASPGLLEIDCRTVEQMRLVNAVCWLGEVGRFEALK